MLLGCAPGHAALNMPAGAGVGSYVPTSHYQPHSVKWKPFSGDRITITE